MLTTVVTDEVALSTGLMVAIWPLALASAILAGVGLGVGYGVGRALGTVDNDVREVAVEVDAEATVEDGLAVAEEPLVGNVGEAEAGREVVAVVVNLVDGVDGIGEGSRRVDGRVGQLVFRIGEVVVADAEVHGELRRQLDVILSEDGGAPVVWIDAGRSKGLGDRTGGADVVVDELAEGGAEGAAVTEGELTEGVLRDDFGLDLVTEIEADAHGLATSRFMPTVS